LALCSTGVQAQDTGMNSGAGSAGMMSSSSMSMQPMAVTGQVLRYYVDRSGFVTAMDVQTADGVRMVRFSPGMAQRLTGMYPVGSTATVYVTGSPMMDRMGGMSMTRYDLVGMGSTMPAPTAMMAPYMVSSVDLLKAEPYTTVGAKLMNVSGKLTGYIADDMGEVLGLVLDNSTLVRVPRENRLVSSDAPSMRKSPLFKGSHVDVVGYPEAPRYGSVSPFGQRVIATAITMNGRAVGPLGFGKMMKKEGSTLFNFDFNPVSGRAAEEVSAGEMGYMTYTTSDAATMEGSGMTPAPSSMSPSNSTR